MKIYIPTYKRVNRQITWDRMAPALRDITTLVVSKEEAPLHRALGRNVVVSADQGKGMAAIRGWIVRHAQKHGEDKVAILDDDLTFQVARDGKIPNATFGEQFEAIAWMEDTLREVPLCALGVRFLDYDNTADYVECCRGMQAIGLDTRWAKGYGVNFDRGPIPPWFPMDDFHITLQTLTRGFRNRVSLKYRTCPAPANAPGGCSEQRSLERQNASASILADLYPQFVKVRAKKAWQGMEGEMYDVTVQWKKAYNANKEKQL